MCVLGLHAHAHAHTLLSSCGCRLDTRGCSPWRVRLQARSAIARLGGGLGLCLADVRLYGAALLAQQVRELSSSERL